MQSPNPLLEVLMRAAEASAQGQLTTSEKSIYSKLENRIQERFSKYPQAQQTLAQFEREPQMHQKEMEDALYRTGAMNDPDIINIARQLRNMRLNGQLNHQSQNFSSGITMQNSHIRQNNPWPMVIIIVAVLFLFAFIANIFFPSFFGIFPKIFSSNSGNNIVVTPTSATSATVPATAQTDATVTMSQQIYTQATSGTPAIDDPLSDNRNNYWSTFNASWGACEFTDGAFHFTLSSGHIWNFCRDASAHIFNNFALQVQVSIVKGDNGGIVFGSTTNGCYKIYVNSAGNYTLYQDTGCISSNPTQILISGSSPAIKTGLNQANVITVIVKNSYFYFYVNNQFVAGTHLSVYNAGTVALTAASIDQATDVMFNNLKAWIF